ncbi:CapA family protein [Salsipaludibacter albus]|uniref:CapA family protein n=1 Tax=Salsipaludibacter albus TaxID=2849650 RepID=UPI001EE49413|nr:CapA family protein [Salsipaludibacter albus]MBY5161970.1 CapA family protein [Salsipaludibacter albus]
MDSTRRLRPRVRPAAGRGRRRGPSRLPVVLLVVLPVLVGWGLARDRVPDPPAPERVATRAAAAGTDPAVVAVPASIRWSRGRPTAEPTPDLPPATGPASTRPRVDAAPSTTPASPTRSTTNAGHAPVTVAFAGDVLPHARVNDRAAVPGGGWDFTPLLDPVRPVLERADLALCHLEVPIAPAGQSVTAYPSFGAPAALVDGIAAAGWDGCSLASNHSLDRGVRGVTTTLEAFDRVGLGHAGTARSRAEGGSITRYDVDGVRIAHLAYTYGLNGYRIPADAPWTVATIEPARIERDAARAAGAADVVVVSLHWGAEGVHAPTADQRDLLDVLLPSDDIDLVVGHHAHVVQPVEHVDGTWVLFGLGNHLSNQVADDERDGLLAIVTFGPDDDGGWEVSGIEAVPTWVDRDTHRVLPTTAEVADITDGLGDQLAASRTRTAAVLRVEELAGLDMAPGP